jgi:hypothetical protein
MADTTHTIGSSGTLKRLVDLGGSIFADAVSVSAITVNELVQGGSVRETKSCGATASTDVTFTGDIPAGTKYIELYCASAALYAVGEATSATCGRRIPAGVLVQVKINDANVAAGKKLHCQSATENAIVEATYLTN